MHVRKKTEKIPFSEDLAAQIAATHGVAPSAVRVWRTRGHIPGAYASGDIDHSDAVPEKDPVAQKITEILNDDRLKKTKFRTLGMKGSDVAKGSSSLTAAEKTGMMTEITELRNKCRRAIDVPVLKNIQALLTDVRLAPSVMLGPGLLGRVMRKAGLTTEEKESARLQIIGLNNFLKI